MRGFYAMYEAFYKLNQNPFSLSPDPAFLSMSSQHREALAGLTYSALTRPGLTVLMGEAGTGKTTLLYSLIGFLERQQFKIAFSNNPTQTREEFYDFLLARLGIESTSTLKSRQLMALQDTLHRIRGLGGRAVLIVDEAQRLSTDLLEEIRLLGNVETPKEKLLDIILAGQPELGETLARREMRQLKQRISRICRLEPLSATDVRFYIADRLRHAGLGVQGIFGEAAIQQIFLYTRGIPRLINSVCDSALQMGFALQSREITTEMLSEVAHDLDLASPGTWAVRPQRGAPMSLPVAEAVREFSGQGSDDRPTRRWNLQSLFRKKGMEGTGEQPTIQTLSI